MKLYSKSQLVKSAVISVLIGTALGSSIAFFGRKPLFSQSNSSSPEAAGNACEANEENNLSEISKNEKSQNQKVIVSDEAKTVSDFSQYTQDEAQNIFVYEKCNEAVVNITTQVQQYNWFFEPIVTEGGSGSGSIIDGRGYVVTNVHVIENASEISISLFDGTSFPGRIIGKDVESDIAVLKFDPPENLKLKTIDFGDSENLKVGQKVIAIGNPFALERTMTTGIISGLGRPIQESSSVIIRNMIQTDAAINPGNSGGPLLDTKGRMIGINTMIMSSSGSSAGVGFAVPVATARRVVGDLLNYGKVQRGTIKITPVQMTKSIARYCGLKISKGILVSSVEKNSNAALAGLKGGTEPVQYGSRFNPVTIYLGGDIITEIDGIDSSTYAAYTSALESKKPGDTVSVKVYRNGEYVTLKIKLESPESRNSSSEENSQQRNRSSSPLQL